MRSTVIYLNSLLRPTEACVSGAPSKCGSRVKRNVVVPLILLQPVKIIVSETGRDLYNNCSIRDGSYRYGNPPGVPIHAAQWTMGRGSSASTASLRYKKAFRKQRAATSPPPQYLEKGTVPEYSLANGPMGDYR